MKAKMKKFMKLGMVVGCLSFLPVSSVFAETIRSVNSGEGEIENFSTKQCVDEEQGCTPSGGQGGGACQEVYACVTIVKSGSQGTVGRELNGANLHFPQDSSLNHLYKFAHGLDASATGVGKQRFSERDVALAMGGIGSTTEYAAVKIKRRKDTGFPIVVQQILDLATNAQACLNYNATITDVSCSQQGPIANDGAETFYLE